MPTLFQPQVISNASPATAQPPRLLDQVREAMLTAGHDPATTTDCVSWVHRFILFHNKRHPRDLAHAEVGYFLEHVGRTEQNPVRAIDAAHAALEFLYRAVLHNPLGELALPRPPRLVDQVRQLLRLGRYALATLPSHLARLPGANNASNRRSRRRS